jgi:hypothetical protein
MTREWGNCTCMFMYMYKDDISAKEEREKRMNGRVVPHKLADHM